MVPVLSLWLPILVSAVLVFIASSVIHMLLGYHASDHAEVPDEERVASALRDANLAPGEYAIPCAGSMKEMGSAEYQEKMNRGPVVTLTVRPPGPHNLGRTLLAWFLFILVVSVFAAYMASRGAGPAGDYFSVFRFAATTAFLAYGVGSWSESVWFGRKWSTTLKNTLDGLIYAGLTGAAFGWLWPGT